MDQGGYQQGTDAGFESSILYQACECLPAAGKGFQSRTSLRVFAAAQAFGTRNDNSEISVPQPKVKYEKEDDPVELVHYPYVVFWDMCT